MKTSRKKRTAFIIFVVVIALELMLNQCVLHPPFIMLFGTRHFTGLSFVHFAILHKQTLKMFHSRFLQLNSSVKASLPVLSANTINGMASRPLLFFDPAFASLRTVAQWLLCWLLRMFHGNYAMYVVI